MRLSMGRREKVPSPRGATAEPEQGLSLLLFAKLHFIVTSSKHFEEIERGLCVIRPDFGRASQTQGVRFRAASPHRLTLVLLPVSASLVTETLIS